MTVTQGGGAQKVVELAYFNRNQIYEGAEQKSSRPSESQQQQRRYRLNSAIQEEREESMTRMRNAYPPHHPHNPAPQLHRHEARQEGRGTADKVLTGSIDSVVSVLSRAKEWPPPHK